MGYRKNILNYQNKQNSKQAPKNKNGPTYKTGDFRIYNPKKYVGPDGPIKYRSSYELIFMRTIEANSNVVEWAAETIVIPYLMMEKIDGKFVEKRHSYITDAYVKHVDGRKFICEIKPLVLSPTSMEQVKQNFAVQKNFQKWKYAIQWCKNNGYIFKIINESHLKTKIF